MSPKEARTILLNDAPGVISEARSPPLICRLSDYEKFCFRDISARADNVFNTATRSTYLRFVSPRKKLPPVNAHMQFLDASISRAESTQRDDN